MYKNTLRNLKRLNTGQAGFQVSFLLVLVFLKATFEQISQPFLQNSSKTAFLGSSNHVTPLFWPIRNKLFYLIRKKSVKLW